MKYFYVTTPIYYPSGDLHIGHVFSTSIADTLARYKKMSGYEVFFLTGSDEHGQKILEKARENELGPKEYLDKEVIKFKNLWKICKINYDKFIRTTDDYHEITAQKIFSNLLNQGYIYKDNYVGKYCISCETHISKSKIIKENGKSLCPEQKHELVNIDEETYFLKFKGQEKFIKTIFTNNFLFPNSNVSELLTKFIEPGLEDLSVTRTTFDWGVKTLEDSEHIIYVWIEALSNYITALGYLQKNNANFKKFWNNNTEILHVVGKEITRFHAIYWPIILNYIGIWHDSIKVMGHGWIKSNGRKMSKSLGNVIDPVALINEYGPEHVRYYLLKEIPMGKDGDFTMERFINLYNSDLANKYGNLLSRTIVMIEKYFGGILPNYNGPVMTNCRLLENQIISSLKQYQSAMDQYNISKGIKVIINLIEQTNNYIDETKPWVLEKITEKNKLASVLIHLFKVLEVTTVAFSPILINSTPKALDQLGLVNKGFDNILNYQKNNQIKIVKSANLFPRIFKK